MSWGGGGGGLGSGSGSGGPKEGWSRGSRGLPGPRGAAQCRQGGGGGPRLENVPGQETVEGGRGGGCWEAGAPAHPPPNRGLQTQDFPVSGSEPEHFRQKQRRKKPAPPTEQLIPARAARELSLQNKQGPT